LFSSFASPFNQTRRNTVGQQQVRSFSYSSRTIGREELALVKTPLATETHRPIPHHEIVGALIETLGFRTIGVVHDEYAVSPDRMTMFGVLDLDTEMEGCSWRSGANQIVSTAWPPASSYLVASTKWPENEK